MLFHVHTQVIQRAWSSIVQKSLFFFAPIKYTMPSHDKEKIWILRSSGKSEQ